MSRTRPSGRAGARRPQGCRKLGRVAVVELLEVGERRGSRLLPEEPEELLFEIRARVPDVVVVRVVEAEQRLLDALVVEVPKAGDGLVLLRQPGDEPIFVDR